MARPGMCEDEAHLPLEEDATPTSPRIVEERSNSGRIMEKRSRRGRRRPRRPCPIGAAWGRRGQRERGVVGWWVGRSEKALGRRTRLNQVEARLLTHGTGDWGERPDQASGWVGWRRGRGPRWDGDLDKRRRGVAMG